MNIETYYVGNEVTFAWLRKAAAALGISPAALFYEFNLLELVDSVSAPAHGQLSATLLGGASLHLNYDPDALMVSRVELHIEGRLAYAWTGHMSAQDFLDDYYPVDVVYGSNGSDWLYAGDATAYGGAGNDVIQMGDYQSIAYGGAGMDAFEVWSSGHRIIRDYAAGEKILFSDYDSLAALAADFIGLSDAAGGGFTLHFRSPYGGGQWSLTLENVAPDAAILGNFVFGMEGGWQVYGEGLQALGITHQMMGDGFFLI